MLGNHDENQSRFISSNSAFSAKVYGQKNGMDSAICALAHRRHDQFSRCLNYEMVQWTLFTFLKTAKEYWLRHHHSAGASFNRLLRLDAGITPKDNIMETQPVTRPPLSDRIWSKEPTALENAHRDALLDEALCESFPASDPIAVCFTSVVPDLAKGPDKNSQFIQSDKA